jgi:hypothetical protein
VTGSIEPEQRSALELARRIAFTLALGAREPKDENLPA